MRKFEYTLLLLIICFSAQAQTNPRARLLLDEDWKFHFGHAGDPAKDFNFSIANIFSKSGKAEGTAIHPRFDDKAWRTLNLPHDWAVELPFVQVDNADVMAHGYKPVGGLFPETSIGWYRKQFPVARADSGNRFSLRFDGIFRNAKIWLNGFYIGTNESGYVGVEYDVTDYLDYSRNNVLVVRVDATQYEGWFYEGAGIYRHVWLNTYHNTHFVADGIFIHANVQDDHADVTVEAEIQNSGLATVSAYLTDRDGNILVRSEEIPVELKATTMQLRLPSPRLWSLEDPYLYRVVAVLRSGGQIVDSVKHRFGVRTITIDAKKGLFLNDQHVKLKGTNNHHDHAGIGSALPDPLHYYRIRLLKELGCNAYRTSHNAPNTELLEACDSLGMLVMDEQRLLNSSPEYMSQFERIIRRDRNHPSVFMWSIGNEEGYIQTNSFGRRIAQTLMARQLQLDPTRTSIYAADLANVYQGINEVIPVRGFNYRNGAVGDYHHAHPDQPIIGTEMGSTVTTRGIYTADSIRAYVPDQDITFPWWASRAEEWWTQAADSAYWLGGFVWTGFDYRGEPTPYKWPNINSHFGIMDMCGFPKNIYYYYQSWWTDKDVLHISPHWNWPGMEGKPLDVWVNTNAEQVELFLNGKSLGKKTMARNSHLKWNVPYQPGKLEAVAWKKGKKLRTAIETTGPAVKIIATADRTVLQADGRDVAVINLTVVDKKGRPVPDANHLLAFTLDGNARFIGVGNGDPSSHEPDVYISGGWKRHLFNGKAQIILQAGKSQDAVTVGVSGAGLVPVKIELQQK